MKQATLSTDSRTLRRHGRFALRAISRGLSLLLLAVPGLTAVATEITPDRPYAQWADLPEPRQFIVGIVYSQSESYHIWAGGHLQDVTVTAGGEQYGIDINQGFVSLQYGILEKWAADLGIGYTTVGYRYFAPHGSIQSTDGLMDIGLGIRYQIFNEAEGKSAWTPTLTARLGVIIPGTYDENFPFAPGTHSYAVQPELLLRKHFGWPGFGVYGDTLFRWNITTGNDQYVAAIGLFQQIKGWELDAGYRHLGSVYGSDIVLGPDYSIHYPRDVREIRDSIEAGFSYTTSKRHVRYGFQSTTVVNGNNSDGKFWVGASVDIPFGGKQEK